MRTSSALTLLPRLLLAIDTPPPKHVSRGKLDHMQSQAAAELRDACAALIYIAAFRCLIPVNEMTVLPVWNANSASSLAAKSFRYI
jgi:hypothetical protein